MRDEQKQVFFKSAGAVSSNQSFLILRQDNRIVFRVEEQIVRYVRGLGFRRVDLWSQVGSVKRTPASKKSMEEKLKKNSREKIVSKKCAKVADSHECATVLSNVKRISIGMFIHLYVGLNENH